ncbi:imidazolonepropionase [Bartonella sp. CB169]|uniref:imidazolonepropionase n=1 Tax=Bartonella sp. CB169 TaxID=3112257 RepID=UPI00300E5E1E
MGKFTPHANFEELGKGRFFFKNARLMTMAEGFSGVGIIEDGVLYVENGLIVYCGSSAGFNPIEDDTRIIDLQQRWVTPGLIDCHTHIIYGGNRAKEFEMRLEGASYEEIARAGGGITSTVSATASMTVDELATSALPRLDHLLSEGVTTIEIKSGYGLSVEAELNMLRAARKIANLRSVHVCTTCLAAHAVPPLYKNRIDEYIDEVVFPVIEQGHAEGLIDAVDGFCENIAFSPEQIARVFNKAKELSLPVKLHAEQLSNLGGAKLAASYGALSADHLEYLDEDGVQAMAAAGTVAVIVPGAFYTIHETRKPPIALLRAENVPIALATDCNPGTSPLTSLLLTMNMAATLFDIRVDECLSAVTREAARALGILKYCGTLEKGKRADFAVWDIEEPAELVYRIGFNPLHAHYRSLAPFPKNNFNSK